MESDSIWDGLPLEIMEFILLLLPIRTIIQSSTVSKKWLSIISSHSFVHRVYTFKKPWLFLSCRISRNSSPTDQTFAFDPQSDGWHIIPTSLLSPIVERDGNQFTVQDGLFIASSPTFSIRPILKKSWYVNVTPLANFARLFPRVGVLIDQLKLQKIVVVSGQLFNVLNGHRTRVSQAECVEMYDSSSNSWEICPPLPDGFWRSGQLSWYLSSTLVGTRFYVFDNEAYLLSGFDLGTRSWGQVYTIDKPPEVMHFILVACAVKYLVFVGLCEGPEVELWKFDVEKKELGKFAAMPKEFRGTELLCVILTQDFRYLRIEASRNMIYFVLTGCRFGILPYPACVCEIDYDCGSCSWRKLPPVPVVDDKVNSADVFCSPILLQNTA